jgi:hypothetical protein
MISNNKIMMDRYKTTLIKKYIDFLIYTLFNDIMNDKYKDLTGFQGSLKITFFISIFVIFYKIV